MNANDPAPADVNAQSLAERIAAFEQRRLDWESTRHAQMLDLQEQSRLLREAWNRLESQQRAVLQARGESNQTEPCPVSESAPDRSRAPTVTESQQSILPATSTANAQQRSTPAPSAVEQFRMLQRDVRAHQTPNIDSHRAPGESS